VEARERLLWTAAALFVFLACCQVPLWGIYKQGATDPFYWLRMIMASNRGTLMELGITPIVTASTIMQLVQGAGLIQVSMRADEDRRLFNAAQKFLALVIVFAEAVAYVLSGMYGNIADLGAFNAIAIVFQLCVTGVIIMMLDDMLQKGYGFGSAISLFIATNVCEGVIWDAFSPTTFNVGRGTEFHGVFIALFHMLFTRSNKLGALRDALYRESLPNLTNLVATVIVTLVVIFLQGWKITLKLRHKSGRYMPRDFDVKLFYTSNMPIILQTALVSNLYFMFQILYRRFGTNPIIRLLGVWSDEATGNSRPIGGLAYYISPPGSIGDMLTDPFQALFYISFIVVSCGLFSYMWIWVSGQDHGKVASREEEQGWELAPPRTHKTLREALRAIVPTAALVGGMAIGSLSVFSDILGARGSGTSILLAVTIIYQTYETFKREARGGRLADLFSDMGPKYM
jgi:protein transport protein SEC61 subunit alpha